jgi:hypothetical protein
MVITKAPPPQASGEHAVIVMHSSVVGGMIVGERIDAETFGKHKTIARKWSVSPPERYAQYDKSVCVMWQPPRKRNWRYDTIVPNNLRYCTIEHDNGVLYDSRTDIPVDMGQFNKTRQEHYQMWAARSARRNDEERRYGGIDSEAAAALDYDPINC